MAVRSQSRTDWLILVLGMAIFLTASLFLNLEKGLAFGAIAFVFATVIQTKAEKKREVLRERRFWITIIALAVAHVVAVALIPIPEIEFGLVVLPFALVDGVIIWYILKLVESDIARPEDGRD